jgi:streptomycin 6-kinase
LANEWDLTVTSTEETPTSFLAFGTRDGVPVVLKVFRDAVDGRDCHYVLDAFAGHGMVRLLDHRDGAVLMERLSPGTALADLVLDGRDAEATEILATVIRELSDVEPVATAIPTVEDWGRGFTTYLAGSDSQLDRGLVERSWRWYAKLAVSQRRPRLLHGDLHHYNILRDNRRGWVAIDPKGVFGEIEYELGAGFRNPAQPPVYYASREVVEQRLRILSAGLDIIPERAPAWAYAQAVLSAIWLVEDGIPVASDAPPLLLARIVEELLPTQS